MDKLEQTWDRYCAALEEMRRHRDSQRRKASACVEIQAKAAGIVRSPPVAGESLGGTDTSKDDVLG